VTPGNAVCEGTHGKRERHMPLPLSYRMAL
jgi:hypothetical protein